MIQVAVYFNRELESTYCQHGTAQLGASHKHRARRQTYLLELIKRMRAVKARPSGSLNVPYSGESTTLLTT